MVDIEFRVRLHKSVLERSFNLFLSLLWRWQKILTDTTEISAKFKYRLSDHDCLKALIKSSTMPLKTKHIKEIGKVEKILVQTIY